MCWCTPGIEASAGATLLPSTGVHSMVPFGFLRPLHDVRRKAGIMVGLMATTGARLDRSAVLRRNVTIWSIRTVS